MEGEMAPAMKLKIDPVVERKPEDSSDLNGIQDPEPPVQVAVSPKTEPILLPEMWAKIFEDLPSTDLETVINTCPEWNKLLSFQKPSLLFPKVLACMRGVLPKNDLLPFRLVNKACKAGVDSAHPENLARIAEGRRKEELKQLIQAYIQWREIMLAELNNRAVGDEANEAIMLENRRGRINQDLLNLRQMLQHLDQNNFLAAAQLYMDLEIP